MIVKGVFLVLCITWKKVASEPAYSNVYVQSGKDVLPLQYSYINYGPPPVPKLSQLTASPVDTVAPYPNLLSPCVAPCVTQPIAQVAPVTNAKILYKTQVPSVPVVVKEESRPYEYAYVVYDESTGDQKAQRELSDGSVVRGQYSFIQPDGYVRQVQYTADDLKGFNAIVTKFLPPVPVNKSETKSDIKPSAPCPEVKSEALTDPVKPEAPENIETVPITVTPIDDNLATVPLDYRPEYGAPPLPVTTDAPTTVADTFVSYNDIIRCVQAAIQKAYKNPTTQQAPSPLTYIILPSGKPC